MAAVSNFEDLEIWRLAGQQAIDIYQLHIQESFSKDWELKNQINASLGSVMASNLQLSPFNLQRLNNI